VKIAAKALARVAVASVIAALLAIALAQHLPGERRWWIELSRYLPYDWGIAACLGALLLAFALGRMWVVASLANLALFATVTMGLVWNRSGDEPAADAVTLRLLSYNVKAERARERPGGIDALVAELRRHAPDVALLQDANGLPVARGVAPADGLGALLGLPHAFVFDQYVVASRHPIRGCETLPDGSHGEQHRFVQCTIDVQGVAVSVVNVHLLTPRRGLLAARREGIEAADEWQRNHDRRMSQARALRRALDALPRPLVVAGDFNAAQAAPAVQTLLGAGLRDSFSAAGRGYGYTYGHALRHGSSFLRIDHVLVSADIGVVRSAVGGAEASEHRPVVTDLFLRRPPTRTP
jgi:endonuclease/exonuclease/phosphatase (EEP) superfamily protein YafD